MITLGLIILGLAFGSFVNALVWRLHEQAKSKKKRAASDEELSIVKGRSMCPHCKHTLVWFDLIPVISWLSLRGKCRYCNKPISWQYPLVEFSTAILFAASYIWWPAGFDARGEWLFISWLASLVGLVALVVYDIRWMLLPNKIVFPVTVIATLGVLGDILLSERPFHVLLLAFAALSIAGGLFYVLFQISNGKWIGGGDVKLGFALGLLLGHPSQAFLMLFFASLLGIAFSLPVVLLKRSAISQKVPFGPFLISATVIVKLFGPHIIDWYSRTFLYL